MDRLPPSGVERRRGAVHSSTAMFIQKPFMRDDFARAVRETLDG
ncbi:MAG: hypothetical protein ABIQ10_13375 [Gemmatimonadaceae bacterium]